MHGFFIGEAGPDVREFDMAPPGPRLPDVIAAIEASRTHP